MQRRCPGFTRPQRPHALRGTMTEPAPPAPPTSPTLPPTIRRLGWLHAANDFTLDFITPLLPAGVPAAWIGLMEGTADAVAQVLKLVTGRKSDATGRRAAWVAAGYGTNAVARPLAAVGMLLAWPAWIVGCRVADRLGKGLRGSASDALVADWIDAAGRARAYAHMRTMDHLGATVGASCAALVAWSLTLDYAHPERLALVVGSLVLPMLLMLWWCRGLADHPEARPKRQVAGGWWPRTPALRLPLVAIGLASLGAKLAPLLILVQVAGIPLTPERAAAGDGWPLWLVCVAWGAISLVQAGAATLAGVLTERMGARGFLIMSWLATAALFIALVVTSGTWLIAAGLGWAMIAGLSDGAEKTWLADLVPKEERALAFGALGVVIAAAMVTGGAVVGFGLLVYGPAIFWVPAAGLLLGALLITRR
jgi:MFS family permease